MDFWQKARTFAEDAAKKSQDFTKEAAKRSQDFSSTLVSSSKLSDLVIEASKRSKEIAVEATKRSKEIAIEASDLIKVEAIKRADQIKAQIPSASAAVSQLVVDASPSSKANVEANVANEEELEKFGVTEELREFVKEITSNTFRDFPLEDDSQVSDIPTISNVRQDLTKWQETHAKLIISTVKEISKLRYELCPRVMKERKFWRIYFILVNSHVTPYEKHYMEEEENKKSAENVKAEVATAVGSSTAETAPKTEASGEKSDNQKTETTTTKTSEQDLDVFLLGDLGDSDDGPDDGDDGLDDDDFDKL